jgi:hypothetical protein
MFNPAAFSPVLLAQFPSTTGVIIIISLVALLIIVMMFLLQLATRFKR